METVADAVGKALVNSRSSSPTRRENGSLRQALADRLLLSDALEHVEKLLRAFPNGGANAGKGYIGALASALAEYPRMVAIRCCDPVHGVSRETRFLPTVADVVAFCERETADMRKPVETEDRDARILREMAERAEAEAKLQAERATRPTIDEMKAKHGPNWGLTPTGHAPPRALSREYMQKINQRIHEAELKHYGMPPDSNVSAALVIALTTSKFGTVTEAAE